jgi:hypothetical protein
MPKPADHDNKSQDSRIEDGRTYDRSVKVGDPGGASPDNPHPARPFVNPNPNNGGMLGPEWEKRSG